MYWEEKMDRIKKETDSKDFRVPFTDWSTILKSIEAHFIVKEDSNNTSQTGQGDLRTNEK